MSARKRLKTGPSSETLQSPQHGCTETAAQASLSNSLAFSTTKATKPSVGGSTASRDPSPANSWYSSWKLKSSPITEVESRHATRSASQSPAGLRRKDRSLSSSQNPAHRYLSMRTGRNIKSSPLAATTTMVNAGSRNATSSVLSGTKEGSSTTDLQGKGLVNNETSTDATTVPSNGEVRLGPQDEVDQAAARKVASSNDNVVEDHEVRKESSNGGKRPEDGGNQASDQIKQEQSSLIPSLGWLTWWSRPAGYVEASSAESAALHPEHSEDVNAPSAEMPAVKAEGTMKNRDEAGVALPDVAGNPDKGDTNVRTKDVSEPATPAPPPASQSWFWLWSSANNVPQPRVDETIASSKDQQPVEKLEDPQNKTYHESKATAGREASRGVDRLKANEVANKDVSAAAETTTSVARSTVKRNSGWAFWSRDVEDIAGREHGDIESSVGELAVANTPSQSRPEAAQFNQRTSSERIPQIKKQTSTTLRAEVKSADKLSEGKKQGSKTKAVNATEIIHPVKTMTAPTPAVEALKTASEDLGRGSLVLPEFEDTYSMPSEPTRWQQFRYYIAPQTEHTPHLYMSPTALRVRRAIAVGVHGFFPSPMMQKIIGPARGTSIRFADHAAKAIKAWTEKHAFNCKLEKVALEGEGFINDRVETLWKLLQNWAEHLQQADLIFFACHSQGVPVTVMLVAKLIEAGLAPKARIGICAMAGVNLGPFVEYKTRLFGPSALELFDFSDPASDVSKKYWAALRTVLENSVRITYVGSLDDQLVSLDSSTFSVVSHPYIYRSVFVDGKVHSPDFITHLVGFALKLRNLGIEDHGLIRELSPALAGSLYTGDGHSRLYDWGPVYDLAVRHTLDTLSLKKNVTAEFKQPRAQITSKEANPFFLPWAMRGVLEEDIVKTKLGDECKRLLELYEEWKPQSKGLKDIKLRLEVLKSKL